MIQNRGQGEGFSEQLIGAPPREVFGWSWRVVVCDFEEAVRYRFSATSAVFAEVEIRPRTTSEKTDPDP